MAIYKGTPTASIMGAYFRPNNATGQTLSLRRKNMNLHPAALTMQQAMRKLASQWGAMSPAEKQSWPNASSGLFIKRKGAFMLDDYGYHGRMAHLLPGCGAGVDTPPAEYVYSGIALPTHHQTTLNVGAQQITVNFLNTYSYTGSARSGLLVFQVHPRQVGNARVQDWTRRIYFATPWPTGNNPELITADVAWPTPANEFCRIIGSWWDESQHEGCNKTPFD